MYQNKVTLIGFLGSNQKFATANNGNFTTISLATKSSYKKDDNTSRTPNGTGSVVFGKLSGSPRRSPRAHISR